MGLKSESVDIGAASDMFREAIIQFDTCITSDKFDDKNNKTTIEYICGEGDPPFPKYRLTLEAISLHSQQEYEEIKEKGLNA